VRWRLVAAVLVLWARSALAQEPEAPEAARRREALGDYAAAAQALEDAARVGGAVRGRTWLERAFTYRTALGDVDGARRDLDALTRAAPGRTASLALDLGEALGRLGRWRESAAHHRAWLQRRARTATTGERLRAWVQLGDALHALRQTAAGDAADRAAVAVMTPRTGSTSELPEAERELLARVLFRQADRAWETFLARVPRWAAPDERRAYDLWTQRVVTPFVNRALMALRGPITRAYTEVVNLHAPRWEVRAYARLAEVFWRFEQLLARRPLPPDVRRVPELLDAMCDRYDVPPPRCPGYVTGDYVYESFQRCLRVAERVRWPAPPVCEQSLAELNGGRFPRHDEMRPSPDAGLVAWRDLRPAQAPLR
jgi:tetratricopeptide (TPR) repeat protein